MAITPLVVIYFIWVFWVLSWWVASIWTNPTVKRAGMISEMVHRIPTIAGAVLLFGFAQRSFETPYRAWPVIEGDAGWALAAIAAAGIALCWWARLHLGRLWSSSVTRKSDHHLVATGPYGLTRHPIYTGIIFASLATAIDMGTWSAFAGFALMTLGWYIKARTEEGFLRQELGRQTYDAYAARVPMLVPLLGI